MQKITNFYGFCKELPTSIHRPCSQFEYHSLRHHPVANGSQSRFCREKTRGICSILRLTSAPCNAASSQNRSLEGPFLWSSVLSLKDTVSRHPLKQVFFEASADVEFELNSLDRGGLCSLRSRTAKICLNAILHIGSSRVAINAIQAHNLVVFG